MCRLRRGRLESHGAFLLGYGAREEEMNRDYASFSGSNEPDTVVRLTYVRDLAR